MSRRRRLAPYGKVVSIGDVNKLPFDKVQNQPGESNWDFLENLARPRGIIIQKFYRIRTHCAARQSAHPG